MSPQDHTKDDLPDREAAVVLGEWRKSGRSNPTGNCVELVGTVDGHVAVRNSRDPGGPVLVYTRDEMAAFLRGAKDGDFDDLLT